MFNTNSVSLCTHSSVKYSKFVFDHTQNWDGSISVALLIDSFGFTALQTYLKLYKCTPNAREKVSTHLVWKKLQNENCTNSFILKGLSEISSSKDLNENCDIEDHVKNGLFNHTFTYLYYTNLLRNIARKGASTDLHFISDIENHISFGASQILTNLTQGFNKESKVAVIIRRFEYNVSYPEPRTIKDLLKLYKIKQAYQFHHFFYARGHIIPGLSQWFNYSQNLNTIPVLYPVEYQSNVWEPQLILHASAPYHYEPFSMYRDHTALLYELCRAGYKFAVASHSFTFHKGIKPKLKKNSRKSVYAWMAHENGGGFRNYLNEKYSKLIVNCKNW